MRWRKRNEFQIFKIGALSATKLRDTIWYFPTVSSDVSDDVIFYLSTNEYNRTLLDEDNLDTLDVDLPFFVLIHGWSTNSTVDWVIDLTAELLDQGDYNVIAVDYTPIAELDYISAVADSPAIGNYHHQKFDWFFFNCVCFVLRILHRGIDRKPLRQL